MQAWLLTGLIAGPVLMGLLAWLVRHERMRSGIVLAAATMTAGAGLWLAWGGPFVLTAAPEWSRVGDLLEDLMIFAVVVLGLQQRAWLVVLLGLVQGGLVIFVQGHAPVMVEGPRFLLDPLSTILVLIISLVGSGTVVYALGYMHRHEHHAPPTTASTGRFFFFLVGFLGLMNGLVLTDSLKWLGIFWEGTTLCSFFLIGHDRTPEARENARRALLINTIGGAALSIGATLAHAADGVTTVSGLMQSAALWPIAFVLLATCTKSAQLPFQSWLLGAMVAPTPVSALLHSSTMVKAGSYLVLRLAPAFVNTSLGPMVAFAGAFTFAVTSAMAISQSNAKKVLAYSTIANLGLIMACAGINTPLAYAAALIILIYHAISKAMLFLCVGTIEQQIGSRDIDDMSGIMFKMPLTTTIAVVGMVSMMAPPFGMLVGKWMAISAAGHTPLVLVLFIIGSALTILFWGKWMGRIITTSYHEEYVVEKLPPSMKGVLILLVLTVVAAGAGSVTVYHRWARPLAVECVKYVELQPDAWLLLRSVDDFMSWPIFLVLGVVLLVVLAALLSSQKAQVRLPYLGGENVGEGAKSFEFRSVMDQRIMAQVTSYYFSPWLGEAMLTRWANPLALLILLSLFARVAVL